MSTFYTLHNPRKTPYKILRPRSQQQGQIKVTPYCTPTTPKQCLYQVSTSYTLQFPRYTPEKILKVKSHHVAQLQRLSNAYTKYQLPTPYGFRDIAREDFKGQGHSSKVKDHIKITHSVAHLPLPTNNSAKYKLLRPYYSTVIVY